MEKVTVYVIRRHSDGKFYHKSGWRDKMQDARFYQNKGFATANVRTVCSYVIGGMFSVEEYELLPTGRDTVVRVGGEDEEEFE
jgi:hypothetical protein